MINPSKITIYNAPNNKLEESILFWVCVAGKNGYTAARCLDLFLNSIYKRHRSPFECIQEYKGALPDLMRNCGIGCYTSKAKSFIQLVNSSLNLKTCTTEDLESIYGIGMKTSRCFILHSRPHARYAGLDTHILKHLRSVGVCNVPKSTPSSKKEYFRLEKEFLRLADGVNMLPSEYDLMIWNKYSIVGIHKI